jgi:hypothetical protein
LRKKILQVNQQKNSEQKSDSSPSVTTKISRLQQRSTRMKWNQRNLAIECLYLYTARGRQSKRS